LLCSKFTDGKGITDTATVNFVFTIENEEIQVETIEDFGAEI
jgi:hypothetical protein